jgi:hypothetical protein
MAKAVKYKKEMNPEGKKRKEIFLFYKKNIKN